MAKLIEILWKQEKGFPFYGGRCILREKSVYTLGRNEECDFVIGSYGLDISRKHAFILSDGRDFYVGDLGPIKETFLSKRKFFSYYSRLRLVSPFMSDVFKRAFQDEKGGTTLEKEFYGMNGEGFDEAYYQREYFLNEFLLDEKKVSELKEDGRYLMLFEHGDKIKIGNSEIVLKKNLFERVSGILR